MNKTTAQLLAFAAAMGADLSGILPGPSNYGREKAERSPELVAELQSKAEAKRARRAAKRKTKEE